MIKLKKKSYLRTISAISNFLAYYKFMKNTVLSRTVWGIAIVILGLGFLLNSLGVLSFSGVVSTYWPLLIILAGVAMWLDNRSNFVIPGFIVLVGLLFQLDRLELIDVNVFQILWPVAIMTIGLSILFHSSKRSKKADKNTTEDAQTDLFAALSAIESKVTATSYQGGKATAILGGISLDLSKAEIKEVTNLSLLTLMGGIELRVPETWNVNVSGTPLLGGWENKANKPTAKKAPTLNIDATCVMGGIEIKN